MALALGSSVSPAPFVCPALPVPSCFSWVVLFPPGVFGGFAFWGKRHLAVCSDLTVYSFPIPLGVLARSS